MAQSSQKTTAYEPKAPRPTPIPAPMPGAPLVAWWAQQCWPLTRVQLAWMESIANAMEVEAHYLKALAESGEHLGRSMTGEEAPTTPADVQAHYQKLVERVTHAHIHRLGRVAELSEEFRNRIWEEI